MTPLNDPSEIALMAEIREAGLITPATIERIDVALGRPERLRLAQVLLAGRDWIDENEWIVWLVRRWSCTRFGPVRFADRLGVAVTADLSAEANLPYRRTADGRLMLAVLRPDLAGAGALRAAATLREMQDLRQAWRRAQRWEDDWVCGPPS